MSLLLPYTLMYLVLDFSQMVLAVRKHLKIAKIIILNNVFYCNFPKKSIPGHVPALALHLGVFGAGLQDRWSWWSGHIFKRPMLS